MDTSTIVWIVFGVITGLVLIFTLIFGFRRTALQSGIRLAVLLVTVIISAVAAALATSYAINYTITYVQEGGMAGSDATLNGLIEYLNEGGVAANDLKQLVGALIAPLVFFVLFIVLNLLFFIIYAIVTACTCSQGHKKRAIKKRNKAQRNQYQTEGNMEAYQPEKYKAGKVNRLVSLGLNLVIFFGIATFLLVPVTYYVPIAANALTATAEMQQQSSDEETASIQSGSLQTDSIRLSAAAEEEDGSGENNNNNSSTDSMAQAREILNTIADNPLMKVYGTVGNVVSQNVSTVKTTDGTSIKVSEVIEGVYPVVSAIQEMATNGTDSLSSQDIYNIAQKIADNKFADELLGGILSDAATKWSNNETFLGIDPLNLQSEALSNGIFNALKDNKNASDAFKAVGHVYSVAQVMQVMTTTGSSTQDAKTIMTNLMDNLTDESIAIVQNVVSEAVISELGSYTDNMSDTQKEKISSVVGNLLNNLKDVSEADRESEAAAVSTVFNAINDVGNLTQETATEVVSVIKGSTVLTNTLADFVDGNPNPMNVTTTEDTKEQITQALKAVDVSESDELYSIVMAFFGIE